MPRDPEATKRRLFDAAVEEFSRQGFAGARTDGIADRAGANRERLYRYFGDKGQLFATVLERQLTELAEAVPLDPADLPEYAGKVFDYHAANRELIRLLHWEALEQGDEPVANEPARAAYYQAKVDAISEGQRAGVIDPSLDPRDLVFTLIAIATWWFTVPQIARMLCSGDPYGPEALKHHRAHVVETTRRLIQPSPATAR